MGKTRTITWCKGCTYSRKRYTENKYNKTYKFILEYLVIIRIFMLRDATILVRLGNPLKVDTLKCKVSLEGL